ncbi:MAG: glycosyltransferase family 39 protein [Acidobacteria bacterium]|nr:glycosyltransferase family 39 protein [Acidobacteriota bacterium]
MARMKAGRPVPSRRGSPPGRAAFAVFLVCLACYLANGRTVPFARGGDTIPTRLLPFSMIAFGTLTLDPFRQDFAAAGGYRWYVQERRGHLVSFYPIGPALLALPVYVPAYLGLAVTGRGGHAALFGASEELEKLAACGLAALAVSLSYLTARRRLPAAAAAWAALGLGLGTSLWATASQMLWQHGPVALSLAAGIFFLTASGETRRSAALAGFALALAALSRPTAGVFWLAGLASLLAGSGPWSLRWRRAAAFVAAGAPILAAAAAYNLFYYGSLLGGYSLALGRFQPAGFAGRAAGLLVSPNRGLLIFTPVAAVGIAGIARALRRPRRDPLLSVLGLAALIYFLAIASYKDWTGGWSFGPRYLTDLLPILFLGAIGELPRLSRASRAVLAVALAWSVLVQMNGAFCYPASRWDPRMSEHTEQAAWEWHHFEMWEDFQAWQRGSAITSPF